MLSRLEAGSACTRHGEPLGGTDDNKQGAVIDFITSNYMNVSVRVNVPASRTAFSLPVTKLVTLEPVTRVLAMLMRRDAVALIV